MQQVLGFSALQTGLAFLRMAAVLIAGSGPLGPRLVLRVGSRRQATGAMLLMAAGFLVAAVTLSAEGSFVASVLPGTVLIGAGMALVFPAFMVAAVDGIAARDQGVASGLINTSQQVGAALGLAVLVVVAASRAEAAGGGEAAALVEGYRTAFLVGTALPLLAASVAATVLPRAAAGRRGQPVRPAAAQVATATLCATPHVANAAGGATRAA